MRELIAFPFFCGEMSVVMLLDHSEHRREEKARCETGKAVISPCNTKLTRTNLRQLRWPRLRTDLHVREWIRDVILREMRGGSAADPSLAEILGVRLLLVNVLRPLAAGQRLTPEAFDKLLDEISEAKHALAGKLAAPAGRK